MIFLNFYLTNSSTCRIFIKKAQYIVVIAGGGIIFTEQRYLQLESVSSLNIDKKGGP